MQQMVRALLGLAETPEPADAADALAVALCHIQAAQAEARLAAGFARGGKLVARRAGSHAAAASPTRAAHATSRRASQGTPEPQPAIPVSR
jgi:crossover junction endodeoxyribonuclease RuvC